MFLKQKRAQGLPMSTIVLLIIAIVVLAAVLLWFFSGSSGTKSATNIFINISSNQSAQACKEAELFGGCPSGQHCCNGVCQAAAC